MYEIYKGYIYTHMIYVYIYIHIYIYIHGLCEVMEVGVPGRGHCQSP